ncbi:MAG: hypothetical protein NUV84_03600, partial [Candidatus Uhrbacteria bacterium]|nr:hypothetical protein [Candidatus Uhrbacteria bacterium]
MISGNILLGPPGVGKTTLQQKYPRRIIDPEESIDWLGIDAKYNPYPHRVHNGIRIRFEHELDWPTVWIKHVLPRVWAAMLLQKDIAMGLITPGNTEIVCRFLETFRNQTTVLLPNELQHFQQTWNDKKKRPKTWGSMLYGWQNTFWIRMLLRGIAQELGLRVVEKAISKKQSPRRKPSTTAREARASNGRVYIEVFFGHWAELDKSEQIVAMHVSRETADGVDLMCDKTSKICANGTHDCDVMQHLTNDVKEHSLTSWIATNKLKSIHGTKNAVIFFTGTLAPFHRGHLATLSTAKAELQKKGWNILGGYVTTFTTLRSNRVGELVDVLNPVQHRHTTVQLGVATSDWLMADHPIDHVLDPAPLKHDQHPVQRIVKRLRECGALSKKTPVTTFWIN